MAAFPASPYPGPITASPEAQCMACMVWSALMLPLLVLGLLVELEAFGADPDAGTPPPGPRRSRSSSPQPAGVPPPQQEARSSARSSLRLRQARSSEGEQAGGSGGGGSTARLAAVPEEFGEQAAPVASGSRAGAAGEPAVALADRAAAWDALPQGDAAWVEELPPEPATPLFRWLVRRTVAGLAACRFSSAAPHAVGPACRRL